MSLGGLAAWLMFGQVKRIFVTTSSIAGHISPKAFQGFLSQHLV